MHARKCQINPRISSEPTFAWYDVLHVNVEPPLRHELPHDLAEQHEQPQAGTTWLWLSLPHLTPKVFFTSTMCCSCLPPVWISRPAGVTMR